MTDEDPIEFSIFLSQMNNVVNEMSVTLSRAAMTPIIALAHDFSCCVYDVDARQIAVHDALPIQTSSMDLMIRETSEAFKGKIESGDVMLCNDPYRGNTHIGDLVVLCPVFVEGRHLFWTCARAHQLDIGAPLPTTTTPWALDVWQEGLAVPPLKIYSAGNRLDDVIEMYLRNLRWRDLLAGDLMAQLGAVWTGSKRLQRMAAGLGVPRMLAFADRAIEYGRDRAQAEIQAMPDGRFEATGWMDSDGAGRRNVEVRAEVAIEGNEVSIDFSGTDRQSPSGFNASRAVVEAAGRIPILMALDPDIPRNQGCLDAITVKAERGSMALAEFPASTGGATTWPGDILQDTVWKALSVAVPDRVRAGTSRWNNAPELYGYGDGDDEPWGLVLLHGGGGGGAAKGCDGWPLITSPAAEGGLRVASVEETELLHPIMFGCWEIEIDSMGAGEWNGGPGVRVSFEPTRGAIDLFNPSDGLDNPPHGVCGGEAGAQGGSFVTEADGSRTFFTSVYMFKLPTGQAWTSLSSGGGGFGDPTRRDAELVAGEVRDGLMSRERAETVYGVILDASGELDRVASDDARRAIVGGRATDWGRPVPGRKSESSWADANAGETDRIIRDEP